MILCDKLHFNGAAYLQTHKLSFLRRSASSERVHGRPNSAVSFVQVLYFSANRFLRVFFIQGTQKNIFKLLESGIILYIIFFQQKDDRNMFFV